MYPEDLKYTTEHEWVRPPAEDGGTVRVGITDFAQDSLGDIVYAQLPEVGATVSAGDAIGELESTKSVNEVYAPLSGEVTAVNDALGNAPETVNSDAYGEGWLFEMRPGNAADLDGLLDAAAYEAQLNG